MPQIKAVIFDFDGVVIMSEPIHRQAWVDLAAEVKKALPEGFLEKGIGSSDQELSNDLAVFWNHSLDTQKVLTEKRRHYQRRIATESKLVAGIIELFQNLHGKFKLGIATSSSITDIEPVFARYGLSKYFDSVMTIEDVTKAKPDPELYLKSAMKLGVVPKECLVFEDSQRGAEAARAAGMHLMAVTTSFADHELTPWSLTAPNYLDPMPILKWLSAQI